MDIIHAASPNNAENPPIVIRDLNLIIDRMRFIHKFTLDLLNFIVLFLLFNMF